MRDKKELAARGAQIALIMGDLDPDEMEYVMAHAGIYTPCISTTRYVCEEMEKAGLEPEYHALALKRLRLRAIGFVGQEMRARTFHASTRLQV